MELDIDMLHSCMEGGVFGEYNGTLIVTEECGWLGKCFMEINTINLGEPL